MVSSMIRCDINFSFKNKGKMGFQGYSPEKYAILLRNRPPGWHLWKTLWKMWKTFLKN